MSTPLRRAARVTLALAMLAAWLGPAAASRPAQALCLGNCASISIELDGPGSGIAVDDQAPHQLTCATAGATTHCTGFYNWSATSTTLAVSVIVTPQPDNDACESGVGCFPNSGHPEQDFVLTNGMAATALTVSFEPWDSATFEGKLDGDAAGVVVDDQGLFDCQSEGGGGSKTCDVTYFWDVEGGSPPLVHDTATPTAGATSCITHLGATSCAPAGQPSVFGFTPLNGEALSWEFTFNASVASAKPSPRPTAAPASSRPSTAASSAGPSGPAGGSASSSAAASGPASEPATGEPISPTLAAAAGASLATASLSPITPAGSADASLGPLLLGVVGGMLIALIGVGAFLAGRRSRRPGKGDAIAGSAGPSSSDDPSAGGGA